MHATLTQDYTLLGSQFSTRKKVHFQFTFKRNFNIRIRVSFQNENHNEHILECSLLAEASFPWYSSPGGRGMEVVAPKRGASFFRPQVYKRVLQGFYKLKYMEG